jgi:hypothetical protein
MFLVCLLCLPSWFRSSLIDSAAGGWWSLDTRSPRTKAEGALSSQSEKDDEMQRSWGLPTQTDNASTRVVVANGCSGSSVTFRFMKKILTARGCEIHDAPRTEMMKPKNKNQRVVLEAMALRHQDALSRGETLLFKSIPGVFRDTFAGVKKLGMRFSHVRCWNSLNRCMCAASDCFPAGRACGFPVHANDGTEADPCFKPRGKSAEKTKAVFPQGNAELQKHEKTRKRTNHQEQERCKICQHVACAKSFSAGHPRICRGVVLLIVE